MTASRRNGRPYPRSADYDPVGATPVKGAHSLRSLASLRDGLRPPWTDAAPHETRHPSEGKGARDRSLASPPDALSRSLRLSELGATSSYQCGLVRVRRASSECCKRF
jgi:hypothetical protein